MERDNFLEETLFISEQIPSQPKRIIICCDGTWQSSTSLDPKKGVESNVTRLCRVLAKAGTDKSGKVYEQVVYYDAGVGTGDITSLTKNLQGGLGIGLTENVLEAYNFVVNNYKKGDEIFFFGFSRGAYTVRAAAGIIADLGVIAPLFMSDFIKLYAEWQKTPKGRPLFNLSPPWVQFTKDNPAYFVETKEKVVIQVIGVWDTVGALGVPEFGHFWKVREADNDQYEFYDTNLSECVKHAFQALALDERRPPFSPSVWSLKDNRVTQLLQCWFPGAHVNVGGGNADHIGSDPTGYKEQLSAIPYAWMLDRIRPFLALDSTSLNTQFAPMDALADTKFDSKTGMSWIEWYKKIFFQAGYARGEIDNSFKGLYWLLNFPRDRTPGRYITPGSSEVTEEYVHPSVHYRQLSNITYKESVYEPAAMKGWVRIHVDSAVGPNGKSKRGWMWIKYKNNDSRNEIENSLWEYEIGHMKPEMSLEKRLIDGSWVQDVRQEVSESFQSFGGGK